MAGWNGSGPASALTDSEARGIVGTGKRAGQSSRPTLNKSQAALAVYDGALHVGDVIERADGRFAFTAAGKLMGRFTTRIEASLSIPASSIIPARGAR